MKRLLLSGAVALGLLAPGCATTPGQQTSSAPRAVFPPRMRPAPPDHPPPASPMPAGSPPVPAIAGPFQPTASSLARYCCPTWFRDAKFGIWAHWSAQCVPEQGDWYARQMYQEGTPDYNFHRAHYGPQSTFGFKDVDHLWRAERWDPDRLMDLYVRAGARYFVALANHHDNLDMWDSRYQPWNSVRVGPHRDIVGTWERAARRRGLRFGVSLHAARSWDWFDVAHGADTRGPLHGVAYDGWLSKADGKGKWWDGLDPVDLYGPAGPERTAAGHARYETKFYNRTMDLLERYRPDFVYFDDGEPPTRYGLQILSSYYNASANAHHGASQVVATAKDDSPWVRQAMVLDYERGRSDGIQSLPYESDTCIGDWHYDRSIYLQHRYKTSGQVIRMLADVVSKNGNLLLSIPVRGDGSIDSDEVAFLEQMAAWMRINGEAIFGTRPWRVFGEGPTAIKTGGFSEGGESRFTAADFRFTRRGDTLYALAMTWPGPTAVIRSLAAGAPGAEGQVTSVTLLGSRRRLSFARGAGGLVVHLPPDRPCRDVYVLRIDGLRLR